MKIKKLVPCPHCNGTGLVHARAGRPTGEQAIELYYRRKAAGGFPKVTIRQVAQDTGLSPDYLRSVKMEYDKAGKWGSKKSKI